MDFILELLFEIILGGSIELCETEKKVPVVLRLLAGIIVGVVYVGLLLLFLWIGITDRSPVMLGMAFVFLIVIVAFGVKFYRAFSKRKNRRMTYMNSLEEKIYKNLTLEQSKKFVDNYPPCTLD